MLKLLISKILNLDFKITTRIMTSNMELTIILDIPLLYIFAHASSRQLS